MQQFFAERMASSIASVCPEVTGIPVTPSGFRNRWISPVVPPYSGVVYTIVLSGRAKAKQAVMIAAIPELNTAA